MAGLTRPNKVGVSGLGEPVTLNNVPSPIAFLTPHPSTYPYSSMDNCA